MFEKGQRSFDFNKICQINLNELWKLSSELAVATQLTTSYLSGPYVLVTLPILDVIKRKKNIVEVIIFCTLLAP